MKNWKRIFLLLQGLLLLISFAACAPAPDPEQNTQAPTTTEPEEPATEAFEIPKTDWPAPAIPDAQTLSAQYTLVLADSELLKYTGRWQPNGTGARQSYWDDPKVSFQFTGSVLDIYLQERANFILQLDSASVTISAKPGWNSIEVPAGNVHTVTLQGRGVQLQGFRLAKDATVTRIPDAEFYVEFVGDSISEYPTSFPFKTPEKLGIDAACYALSGIALKDTWGYYTAEHLPGWNPNKRVGMESSFFYCEEANEKLKDFTPYEFGNRIPDALVVFIGTNDKLNDTYTTELFTEVYTNFIAKVRCIYPSDTTRLILCGALTESHTGFRISAIKAATEAVLAMDDNAMFVDLSQWDVEISQDGVHPTVKGYAQLTEGFAALLAQELGLEYAPPAATMDPVRLNDLATDVNGANGLTFYYTLDQGATIVPFENYNPTGGRMQNGQWTLAGKSVAIAPQHAKAEAFAVGDTGLDGYIVVGYKAPATGQLRLDYWTVSYAGGGNEVCVALGSPGNIVAGSTGTMPNPTDQATCSVVLDVEAGQEIFLIYKALAPAAGDHFGYTATVQYLSVK